MPSLLGFTVVAIGGHWQVALAGVLSLAGLWVLLTMRTKLDPEMLDRAADAVLFAPPIIVLAIWLGC